MIVPVIPVGQFDSMDAVPVVITPFLVVVVFLQLRQESPSHDESTVQFAPTGICGHI